MRRAWTFLLDIGSGRTRLDLTSEVRREARDIVKHFPLGGDVEATAWSYASKLLCKVEQEDDQLKQEAERDRTPVIPPDYLNMP